MDLRKKSMVILGNFSWTNVKGSTLRAPQIFCNIDLCNDPAILPVEMLGNLDTLLQRSYRRKWWLFQKRVPPIVTVVVDFWGKKLETPIEVEEFLSSLSLVTQTFKYPQCLPVISGKMLGEISSTPCLTRMPVLTQLRLFEVAKDVLSQDLCGMDLSRFFASVPDHPTQHLYPLDFLKEATQEQGIRTLRELFRECSEGTLGCVPIGENEDQRSSIAEFNQKGNLSRNSRIALFQQAILEVYELMIANLSLPVMGGDAGLLSMLNTIQRR